MKSKKKYNKGGYLPPAIRALKKTKQDPALQGGLLDEVTVSAPMYNGPMIRRSTAEELQPINSNFRMIGADRSGGLSALRGLGRGIARLFKSNPSKIAKNIDIDAIQNAYSNQMSIPAGANMNISDEVFSGGTLYGRGAAFDKAETLNRIADFQKDLSPVPFVYTHGTGSSALPGIFKNRGLVSAKELEKAGKLVTGEGVEVNQMIQGVRDAQNTVSTASIANPGAAAGYAIRYGKGAGNYPVVFGINPRSGVQARMSIPRSTIEGEVMFNNGIGFDEISNIFIPDANKVEFMNKYGGQLGNIKVGSFDDYVNQAQALQTKKIRGASPFLYKNGGEVDPPKKAMSNQELAMFLRKMISNKIPVNQMGSPVSSSMNYVGDADDGGFVTIDNKRSHYNQDGSVTFDFGKYGGGENMSDMKWFGVPVKKNRYEMDYIDPITLYPFEQAVEVSRKESSGPEPLKLVDPFPNVYGRKMDASGTKTIYNTDKGTIVKKKGKEDADFVRLMMRLGRNYR